MIYGLVERLERLQRSVSEKDLILLDLDFVADLFRELKAMNEHKEGVKYRYPESFVKLLAIVHAYVLPYGQLEGDARTCVLML